MACVVRIRSSCFAQTKPEKTWNTHNPRAPSRDEVPVKWPLNSLAIPPWCVHLVEEPNPPFSVPVGAVHLASRIEVVPAGTATAGSGASPRPSTIYFYIGLDCGDAAAASEDEGSCSEAGGKGGAGLVVVDDSGSSPRRSLLVRGDHPRHGGFDLEAAVARTPDGGGSSAEGEGGLTFAFMGTRGVPIVDIKQQVEKLHKAHRRTSRGVKKNEGHGTGPFVFANTADVGSSVVVVQVSRNAPKKKSLLLGGA